MSYLGNITPPQVHENVFFYYFLDDLLFCLFYLGLQYTETWFLC